MAQRWVFPLEALSALGIIGAAGLLTGWGLGAYQKWENYGKPRRFNVDKWDRQMMSRDSRLTGNVNIQQCEAVAPPAFKTNSALEFERRLV
ncbi:hypothetical protein DFJ73DRAFT_860867 [Zopfochytrium polystomum]|nr:hypothetical protein DFJ73DRAFT_860867 [Zopfochytrium polystomum]